MRSDTAAEGTRNPPGRPKAALSYQVVPMLGELLLLIDPLCLLAAAWVSTRLYEMGAGSAGPGSALALVSPAVWVLAVLAPFILRDGRLGTWASLGQMRPLLHSHALRLGMLGAIAGALAVVSGTIEGLPIGWILLWAATSASATALARIVFVLFVRRLQRVGRLTEVVAVVGAGPLAQRLVDELRQARPYPVDVIGVFDDAGPRTRSGAPATAGTIDELLRIATARRIDWVLLALEPAAHVQVPAMLKRLKALSVPIGLCPQQVGPWPRRVDYLGENIPVTVLVDDRDGARSKSVLPDPDSRWIMTLFGLLQGAIASGSKAAVAMAGIGQAPRQPTGRYTFDDFDLNAFIEHAAQFGHERFGFVVTPNADHLIRLHEEETFRARYAQADYILLDSRFLAHLLRWTRGVRLPVCTGSDLTARLFTSVIQPDDPVVLIGGNERQANALRSLHGLRQLHHHNPPMGFIRDPKAVEDCLRFVEDRSPFRFCLLAVGSPQQEVLAGLLKARGRARGLALCIGAAINFLTGDERRAPVWMQQGGLEWLFRLVQAPKRMAQRYLVRGPRVFGLLRRAQVVLRPRRQGRTANATGAGAITVPGLRTAAVISIRRPVEPFRLPGGYSEPRAGRPGPLPRAVERRRRERPEMSGS